MNDKNETPIEDTTTPDTAAADPVVETAPAVDEAASSEGAGDDVPAVADPDAKPTVHEAEAMFAANPGLASVLTERGVMTRDGVVTAVAHGS